MIIFRWSLLLLTALSLSCAIQLGPVTQPTSLKINLVSPLPSRALTGRLVTPDTTFVRVTVYWKGSAVSTATGTWEASTGTGSATVPLVQIPQGVPITISASAFSGDPEVPGSEALTAQGAVAVTLLPGEVTANIVLLPPFEASTPLVGGTTVPLTLQPGEWGLRSITVESGTAFKVTLPVGLEAYLQSPTGDVIRFFGPQRNLDAGGGSWTLLYWNHGTEAASGNLQWATTTTVDWGYRLQGVTVDDLQPGYFYELRLYDRPASTPNPELLQVMTFTGMAGDTNLTLNWDVPPQAVLVGVALAQGGHSEESVEIVADAPTSAGSSRWVWAYSAEVYPLDQNAPHYLRALSSPLVAPTGFAIDSNGIASWNSVTPTPEGYELKATTSGDPNNWFGEQPVYAVSYDLLTQYRLPNLGTTTYAVRARFVDSANGFLYKGPVSGSVSVTRSPNTATSALRVTTGTPTSIQMDWDAASTGVAGQQYQVQRSVDGQATWQSMGTTNNLYYTDTAVSPATEYFYRIVTRSSNGGGQFYADSDPSAAVAGATTDSSGNPIVISVTSASAPQSSLVPTSGSDPNVTYNLAFFSNADTVTSSPVGWAIRRGGFTYWIFGSETTNSHDAVGVALFNSSNTLVASTSVPGGRYLDQLTRSGSVFTLGLQDVNTITLNWDVGNGWFTELGF